MMGRCVCRRPAATGRSVLLWTVVFFLGGQAGLLLGLEWWRPHFRDPEYDLRLAALRARQAQQSGRPLVLMLGNSRTAMDLRPGLLACNHAAAATAPLVFNFGYCSSYPVAHYLSLCRLLEDHVHPRAAVLEVWPPQLTRSGQFQVDTVDVQHVNYRDFRLLQRFAAHPGRLREHWCRLQLLPGFSHRAILLARLAADLALPNAEAEVTWRGLDGWGWLAWGRNRVFLPAYYRTMLTQIRSYYRDCFRRFRISPDTDLALHNFLTTCRQEGIAPVLILMPEPTPCRRWYPAAVQARVDAYLRRLSREYQARLVDARHWVKDSGFYDGVHLTYAGAAAFTRRFEREVLSPLTRQNPASRGRQPSEKSVE